MSFKKDGYEVEDSQAMCEEVRREKSERRMRIMGYDNYGIGDSEKTEGFVPRNNVNERL